MLRNRLALLAAVLTLSLGSFAKAQNTACPFETTDADQLTRCLLRPVRIFGNLGPALTSTPAPLDGLVGTPTDITREKLRAYLTAHGVPESAVGGSVSAPIPSITRYFVIHDTSAPYLRNLPFPSNINEATWRSNRLANWNARVTHVYVNRLGESKTVATFNQALRATKYEFRGAGRRGKFVHIELIQPRRREPSGGPNNDAIAPSPGFPPKQLERLALLYVTASIRRGQWLLPAFHASVDAGIRDAHDDPQNFDLDGWLAALQSLLTELRQ